MSDSSMKKITAEAVASAFLSGWISRYGTPFKVTTDQGRQFESNLFREFAKLLGINVTHTTPYHPQANGQIERWHRTMKAAIKCYKNQNWIDALPIVMIGLHSTVIQDIGVSPAEMVFGENLRLPGELFDDTVNSSYSNEWIDQFRDKMRSFKATPGLRHCKNNSFVPSNLQDCSHVFVRCDAVRKPLQRPYDGPFKVISRTKKCLRF